MKHPLEGYPGDPLMYQSIQYDIKLATGGTYHPERKPRSLSSNDFSELIRCVKEGSRK